MHMCRRNGLEGMLQQKRIQGLPCCCQVELALEITVEASSSSSARAHPRALPGMRASLPAPGNPAQASRSLDELSAAAGARRLRCRWLVLQELRVQAQCGRTTA